jgi:peptide subunit release factor 1 (eRF1)
VLVCPEEMRGRIADELSQEARDAIVGWTTAEAHAGATELLRVVQPVLAEADARRHEAALDRFREGKGRSARATAGWADTLEAAADARVDTLLLTEGANRTVFQCPECRRAYVEDGTCPIDDVALVQRDDAASIAVRHALVNSGNVLLFGAGALDGDEVGALLRF